MPIRSFQRRWCWTGRSICIAHRHGGAGAVLAQSRAAMLVVRVLDPQPGERVLDLCAAPGGKTTHIAALMGGEGEVRGGGAQSRSGEPSCERRREPPCTPGASACEIADADRAPRRRATVFDRVLVDPPVLGARHFASASPTCAGESRRSKVSELAHAQAAILAAGADALRPGGVLVYSTCTHLPCRE